MRRETFLTAAVAAVFHPERAGAQIPTATLELARLEARSGGRLGVFAFDNSGERRIAYRAGERFPMCSTFKFLAVSAVLGRVDRRRERLDRRIRYGRPDLLHYAPVTAAHVNEGSLSIAALCAAAIARSDNTAANLLLRELGGPAEVTHFARTIGDPQTRLDRTEPTLNTALAGDPRDTTTPQAMARNLSALLVAPTLSNHSRKLLAGWLGGCQTGRARLRAGIPAGWGAGDKTGSGENGTANDIAIFYPRNGAPIFVAAYLTGANVSSAECDAVLARVDQLTSRTFAR